MSYYQPPESQRSGRRAVMVGIAVVAAIALVVALAVGAYLLGRGSGDDGATGDGGGAAAPGGTAIRWSEVGGFPVPAAAGHGPRGRDDGRAVGFAHDELGAALAALNISGQLSSEAGPQVYETTAREQCFGDVETMIERIRNSGSTSPQGASTPSELWYRISSGDPEGDVVIVSIALKTPQAAASGGYVGLDSTLRWVDGDWQMQVPPAPPSIIPAVDGYVLLGRPDV